MPLEATGAGAYAGSLPLARPGAYLATAVDEQTNETLATTAAALSAGEELRPTGTDRGLLRQITRVTGGKVRDTLAGIFADREALRFAYQNLNQWLVVLAAGCLLLGVAARRLAIPDFVTQTARSLGARLDRGRTPSSRARPSVRNQSVVALQKAKAPSDDGSGVVPFEPRVEQPRLGSTLLQPPSTPSFSRPFEAPPGARPGSIAPSSTRTVTAAEVLLARRRGKKP